MIAFFVTYGILAGVCWFFLLVINVWVVCIYYFFNIFLYDHSILSFFFFFETIVFMSLKMQEYRNYYYPICFGLPLIAIIVLFAMDLDGHLIGIW